MKKQVLFAFDYCGYCLWSEHQGIKPNQLPISKILEDEINSLCDEFDESLDWNCPQNPSFEWTEQQWINFFDRASITCKKLQNELGSNYEVINYEEIHRFHKDMYINNEMF